MKTNVPELPEVHTVTKDIEKALTNFVINNVWYDPLYKKLGDPQSFEALVKGSAIIGTERVAKNILLKLSNKKYILIHLAMTGRVFITESQDETVKWVKVRFELSKDKTTKLLHFSDVRMFGKVKLIDDSELNTLKNKYGPEPIAKINTLEFKKRLAKIKKNIKTVLLDQTIISGLGNIYATEALFMAKIHPETPAGTISEDKLELLLQSAEIVLKEGIQHRGSTLSDKMFVDAFGKEGTHQNFFKIYNKTICPTCNSNLEYKKIGGRGSYFCPVCQKF